MHLKNWSQVDKSFKYEKNNRLSFYKTYGKMSLLTQVRENIEGTKFVKFKNEKNYFSLSY